MNHRQIYRVFTLLFIFLAIPCSTHAETFTVPSSKYRVIQDAIDAATHGDIIQIRPAAHFTKVEIDHKDIILQSLDPNDLESIESTIIYGYESGRTITVLGVTENCIIQGLTISGGKTNSYCGAGIGGNGTPTIRNCIITGNEANPSVIQDGPGGPYIYSGGEGGGIGILPGGIVENCIIAFNKAYKGGGIAMDSNSATIRNNIIYGNTATGWNETDGSYAGGIDYAGKTIVNNIIWGNSSPQVRQVPMPSYCCIQDWEGGGVGNISADPRLSDPENRDFYLSTSSPCIDAGTTIPELTADIRGQYRPIGQGYDIGAFESTYVKTPDLRPRLWILHRDGTVLVVPPNE